MTDILTTPFRFATVRHTTAAFAGVFSNLRLQRFNTDGTVRKTIRVPIAYGPKRAWYIRTKELLDANFAPGHSIAMVLPRMSFQMTGLVYDPARAISATNKFRHKDIALARILNNYQGMPWDIQYQLSIMVKNTDDGLNIIEQIIPQFKPQLSRTITEIPRLGLERDVPIIFNGIQVNDDFEEPFSERQLLTWDLTFTAKTYFYPPITDAAVIKKVNAYINANPDMTNRIETIIASVDPLSANEWDVDSNGNPTYSINTSIVLDSNAVPV